MNPAGTIFLLDANLYPVAVSSAPVAVAKWEKGVIMSILIGILHEIVVG